MSKNPRHINPIEWLGKLSGTDLKKLGLDQEKLDEFNNDQEFNTSNYIHEKTLNRLQSGISEVKDTLTMAGRIEANNHLLMNLSDDLTPTEKGYLGLHVNALRTGIPMFDSGEAKLKREIDRITSLSLEEATEYHTTKLKKWLELSAKPHIDKLKRDIQFNTEKRNRLSALLSEMINKKYKSKAPAIPEWFQSKPYYIGMLVGVGLFELPMNFGAMNDIGLSNNLGIIILAFGISAGMAYSAHVLGAGLFNKNKYQIGIGAVVGSLLWGIVSWLRILTAASNSIILILGLCAFIMACFVAFKRSKNEEYFDLLEEVNSTGSLLKEKQDERETMDKMINLLSSDYGERQAKLEIDTISEQKGLLNDIELRKSVFLNSIKGSWSDGIGEYRSAFKDQARNNEDTINEFWDKPPPELSKYYPMS